MERHQIFSGDAGSNPVHACHWKLHLSQYNVLLCHLPNKKALRQKHGQCCCCLRFSVESGESSSWDWYLGWWWSKTVLPKHNATTKRPLHEKASGESSGNIQGDLPPRPSHCGWQRYQGIRINRKQQDRRHSHQENRRKCSQIFCGERNAPGWLILGPSKHWNGKEICDLFSINHTNLNFMHSAIHIIIPTGQCT